LESMVRAALRGARAMPSVLGGEADPPTFALMASERSDSTLRRRFARCDRARKKSCLRRIGGIAAPLKQSSYGCAGKAL
jgi:hypothetical protein